MDVSPDWIDAHAHLTDPRISESLEAMLEDCERAGIRRFVLGGVEPVEWEKQKALACIYPNRIYTSFGLHPWHVAQATDAELTSDLAVLEYELLNADASCVAVGETGLDFHPRFSKEARAVQERAFRAQLRLAFHFQKPVILHIVQAHERALEILHEERRDASNSALSGIVHSFADEPRIARAYLDLGLLPSISAAVITRERGSAFEKLRQTMVTLLAKEFVLETDAPDQPPYPRLEGIVALNPPVNLLRVAEAVAGIRKETSEEVLHGSRENVFRIFRITP
jgi:TatD DNase family protein